MWSKKPTPVSRSPAPCAVEREADLDLGLAGLAFDQADAGHRGSLSRMRASIDRAWSSKPSARASGAAELGELRRVAPMRTSLNCAQEVLGGHGRRRTGRRRSSAGCGSSRRCSRRTPCRRSAPTNTQPARVTRSASASAVGADELQVLGGERLRRARSAASAVGAATRHATAPVSAASVEALGRTRRAARRRPMPRPRACPGRARPGRAGRARAARDRRRRGDHEQVARAGEAVDADLPEHLALGLLHVQVAGADDHVDAGTVSVP